jgi:hypothetical protein
VASAAAPLLALLSARMGARFSISPDAAAPRDRIAVSAT